MNSNITTPHHDGKNPVNFGEAKNGELTILPKKLNIVWGRDKRYWNIPEDENSPVELYQVCWLEVTGCVNDISPDKNYEVIFDVRLTPDAFGWAGSPIYLMVKRGKDGKFSWKKFILDPNNKECKHSIISKKLTDDEKKAQELNDGKLYFGLYEVWSGKWKGGLKIFPTIVKEMPEG